MIPSCCLPGAWALSPACHLAFGWVISSDNLPVLRSGICLALASEILLASPLPSPGTQTQGLPGTLLVSQGSLNI